MNQTINTDFKVKRLKSMNSTVGKLHDQKSQTTKQNTIRDSLSRLKFTAQSHKSVTGEASRIRRPQRPSTGKKKQTSMKIIEPEVQSTQSDVVEARSAIEHLLGNSKIRDSCRKLGLGEAEAEAKLKEPIFVISFENFIQKNALVAGETDSYKKMERFVVNKLESDWNYREQERICNTIEDKIKTMIQNRLKKLQEL